MPLRQRAGDVGLTVALFAGLLGLWYLIAWIVEPSGQYAGATASKLPYPHLIVERIVEDRDTLAQGAWTTVSRALLGFAIGSAAGFLISIILVQARWLESSLMPYVLGAQMIPLVALIPIARTIFADDQVTRIFIAAFITFFSVTIAGVRGLRSAPPQAHELMHSYNAGRLKTLRYLLVPAALPFVFSGLRIAAPLSLVGAIVVDLMGAQQGLGYLMLAALTFGPAQWMLLWSAMVITLALGFLMTRGVALAERLLTPWQVGLRTKDN
jgi:NitT/TauT family transport system permease protein